MLFQKVKQNNDRNNENSKIVLQDDKIYTRYIGHRGANEFLTFYALATMQPTGGHYGGVNRHLH